MKNNRPVAPIRSESAKIHPLGLSLSSCVTRFVLIFPIFDLISSSHCWTPLFDGFRLSCQQDIGTHVLFDVHILPHALNSNICGTILSPPVDWSPVWLLLRCALLFYRITIRNGSILLCSRLFCWSRRRAFSFARYLSNSRESYRAN